MSTLPVLGFIGIGRMGLPMTANLLRAGFTVHAYDILPERVDLVSALGAIPAPSVAAVAVEADIILSMIMDDTVLEAVALGEKGVLSAAKSGAIFADMSTVSPVASQKVATAAAACGVHYLRAKVSGSVKPAEEGALTIFASGPRQAFDACAEVFQALGTHQYYVGEDEEAIYLKLVHSIMVGITAAMIGEAFAFGERGGTDWVQMIDVINNSALNSVLFDYKAPLLRARAYEGQQSSVDIAAKDIDLALKAANQLRIPMPLTSLVREFMRSMQARDRGDMDFIGIVTLFEEMAGLQVQSE
jgi:3-hydroxyisobutyrate dehydrogenase-like beta-hydroxyacid dehydrogenase